MIAFDELPHNAFNASSARVEHLDKDGHFNCPLASSKGTNVNWLPNPHARLAPSDVLSVYGEAPTADLWPCYNLDHHGADIEVVGQGRSRYCLTVALSGAMHVVGGHEGAPEAHGSTGFVVRAVPGTRTLTTDGSARLIIWMDAERLETLLQSRLGEPPRKLLTFAPGVDWNAGPGRVVWRQLMYMMEELRDPGGLFSEPVSHKTFTDLFLQTALSRLPHNYTARLDRPASAAVPRHVRRAEAFMRDQADKPLSMVDVAAAAGCGTATLYAAFRRFRDTTPLAALHAIRLEHVREALQGADDAAPIRGIARRYGFTNPSRFAAAYGKQFGEHPNETRRRRPI